MTNYRGPWNAAGVRHRQTPRVYKKIEPVGEKKMLGAPRATDMVHQRCGMHVCSCAKTGNTTVSQGTGIPDYITVKGCGTSGTTVSLGEAIATAFKAGFEKYDGAKLLNSTPPVPEGGFSNVPSALSFESLKAAAEAMKQLRDQPAFLHPTKFAPLSPVYLDRIDGELAKDGPVFEGRPLRVGDRIVNADTDSELYGEVTRVDALYVVYGFRHRADGRWCSGPPFTLDVSGFIQDCDWKRCD